METASASNQSLTVDSEYGDRRQGRKQDIASREQIGWSRIMFCAQSDRTYRDMGNVDGRCEIVA